MSEVNRWHASRSFKRRDRLLRSAQFSSAYALNRRFAGEYMILYLGREPDASLRLGVVASRKVGNAVQRNRAKRRLREAWRLNRHAFHGALDAVLVARRAVLKARWQDVETELLSLASLAGLLKK